MREFAVILAGGSGSRMRGSVSDKVLVPLLGKPVIMHSFGAFVESGRVGKVVFACRDSSQQAAIESAVEKYFPGCGVETIFCRGGAERGDSVFNGLTALGGGDEIVFIHDGARPLISSELIAHTINTLKGNFDADGAVVAHPAIDTLKVVEDGVIVGTPDRSVFWNAQTPQVFRTGIYRRAHASALSDGFVGTDDSSLIERLGGRVLVVEGKRDNIKLTVPEDYLMMVAAVGAHLREKEGRDL